jgi:predicted dehydrogenase
MDAVTHEHDFRHAIGRPGARDSRAVKAGLAWLREWTTARNPEGAQALFGAGVNDFDLLRCLTGRRSEPQVIALGLDIAVLRQVLHSSPLRIPAATVGE